MTKSKTPSGKVELIPISEIQLNQDNPRSIDELSFEKLCNSIKEFPKMMWLRPIVISRETMIIQGGNQRYKACEHLGWEEVPVLYADTLTDDELQRFVYIDNYQFGDWDLIKMREDKVKLEDWGMNLDDIFGDDPIEDEEENASEDEFDIGDVSGIAPEIKKGDIIEIGQHRLICASSTIESNWEKLMNGELATMSVTDPPYNVDYVGKTKDALKIENDKKSDSEFYQFLLDFYSSAFKYTKEGGAWYVWHADSEGANFRKAFIEAGFKLAQCLIWVKDTMVMGRQDYHWKHEPCLYGWKPGAAHNWYTDRKQTTVLEFDRPKRNTEHPTMKPIPLIAYQIGNSSKKGDIVIDGFLGSGTTMVASHQMGRVCYGSEIDPKYCHVIVNRMLELDPNLEIKKNGKQWNPK